MAFGRRQYPFHLIEPKWQRQWEAQQAFRAWNPGEVVPADHPFAGRHAKAKPEQLPKFYILDMFPYPSGAGLHVGHPEGYTATDILSRYRRALGYNVLHPIGWDAFGLPAEQYAIKTGQHPRKTTEQNIATFKRQIKSLGFSYDWSREVDTTDPQYFKWTQWIFLQLYNSYFDPVWNKATPIALLEDALSDKPEHGNKWQGKNAFLECMHRSWLDMGAGNRASFRRTCIDSWRLAYVAEAPVWWCEQLGTVLANEEVVDGKSEVGDFPVVRKPMRQWMLRITAYAERLLQDLDTIEWSHSLKEMQRNWIGRSEGAEVDFAIAECGVRSAECERGIRVFTTRPDTLFGATYMVLAPEHKLVDAITTPAQRQAVGSYKAEVTKKSDLERTELAKEKTGVFTGGYAINPVTGERIPVWIADYVLISYGTGAIMAVPGHDTRDFEFATKFNLPIVQVVEPPPGIDWRGYIDDGVSINSAGADISISGLPTAGAKRKITAWLESKGLGKKTINYKLRDWLFSRQRYWGEPFPIIWKTGPDGRPYHEALPESALPLVPPRLDDYKPTPDGQPPLARAQDWVNLPDGSKRETNTMPQWAGSCWYYLRYLDTKNSDRFVDTRAEKYWMGHSTLRIPATAQELDAAIRGLVELTYLDPGAPRRRVAFGQVTPELARQISAATGLDLDGYIHVLDNYGVRHSRKEHSDPGAERRRGQEAVDDATFLLIPLVVLAPDSIEHGGKSSTGLDVVRFKKRVNGNLVVVEEVRASKNLLAVVTVYKLSTAAGNAAIGAPPGTSQDDRRTEILSHHLPQVKLPTPGVDLYVGGTEHAVLHLLYARFWHKVLFDLGHVSTPEPFYRLVNQGLILGEDGQKMSKSRGNVINPDDILIEYGADAFRLYEMFMGPLEMVKPWSTKGVEGVYRFLGRVWRLFVDEQSETEFEQSLTTEPQRGTELLGKIQLAPGIGDTQPTAVQLKALHACIKKVTEDLDGLRFNTAISALMVFINEAMTWDTKPSCVLRDFLILLQPFAPHVAEELWAKLRAAHYPQHAPSLTYAAWPKFDPALLVEDTLEIPVQVNGKLRDVIKVAATASQADLERVALASEKVRPFLEGKTIRKVIVLSKRLVNIVAT